LIQILKLAIDPLILVMGGTAHVVSNSLDCRSALFVGSFDARTNNLDFN
jgi:hypothetical protein